MKQEEINFSKNDAFNTSMIPSKGARWLRNCAIWQFIRFVMINLKMLVVVKKSH
ncbi:MAG: hypothetical protein RBS91_00140 [Sulfurimonadaceae bacterium]|jgi:hypothetical protein|nr:hypothetical protein [Sulfurimonadaceae bacterium]